MDLRAGVYVLGSLAATAGLLAETPVAAQAVAPTREELTRPQLAPPPAKSTLNVIGGVERSPCPLANPEFNDVRVTISNVDFHNLKGATPEEMRQTWAEYAGTDQPVSIICEIRDRAATYLRNKGYLAAVQVPTQRIENGQVRLELLYARVTTIRARGQTGGAEAKLAGYLSKLTQDEIFDRNRAERYLLLARDLPGYNVQLVLKPAGTAPGEMIGEVNVIRRAYAVDAMVSNLAAKETGRWGGQLRAQAFGLTGLGDETTVSIYSTSDFKEQQILQASHSFRPGNEGLTISGQFTYAWSQPALDDVEDNLKSKTLFASLGAAYPLIRTQEKNLTLGAGFDFVNQNTNLLIPIARDRLRVIWARADFDAVDLRSRRPKWRVAGTLELRHGIDVFDASESCPQSGCSDGSTPQARIDADPTAMVVRFNGTAEVGLFNSLAVAVSPRAQYAFDKLLSFEQFTLGNYTVGRGYEPSIITGDSGVGVAVELRGPRLSPFQRMPLSLQPYAFGDAAWAWTKGALLEDQPGAHWHDPRHLKSVGAGVRGEFSDRAALDMSVAVPIDEAGLLNERRKPGPRFLLTFTTRLLPWS
ncbi:ShlB/FhaC/HecB family hemolysin secretion/activation protein [Sphingomonas alba]|uniref:ShlB/FhaC/HecB family hemolysin secretion/activation protein n=1 Tax=Sphingomonas alba TaxID=2908208 RepID=A0ABT0RMT9_9SPHN|nr:ShlB/FhaC/HecB family hemolysin secretion/activation protein [Sphingomonas alba]MCL6683943.1 ShlB/FhaC/HecB family hemolysin secretion/activation protein [Sphingomonas alba]